MSRSKFRPARINDYVIWLELFMRSGGKPTHFYDRSWSGSDVLVALEDFRTGGECGADSMDIIVPQGIQHLGGELGHCKLFFLDGPVAKGGLVPVYNDREFDRLDLKDFIAAGRAADLAWDEEQEALEAEYEAGLIGSDLPNRRHG